VGVANDLRLAILGIVQPRKPDLLDLHLAKRFFAMKETAHMIVMLVRPHDHVQG